MRTIAIWLFYLHLRGAAHLSNGQYGPIIGASASTSMKSRPVPPGTRRSTREEMRY